MVETAKRSWRERLWILARSSMVGVVATLTDLCTLFLLARLGGTAVVYLGFSFPLWTFIFRKPALASEPLAG